MPNTISDLTVTSAAFVSSGITAGLGVDVQNKSGSVMIVQKAVTQPVATVTDGYYVVPNQILQIPADVNSTASVWIRSTKDSGSVMVRDTTLEPAP